MIDELEIPELFQGDVKRAAEILREAGCTHVYLFGSLTSGEVRDDSDIDLAIRDCPKGEFFHLLGKLLLELEHPVDLVSLDGEDAFARFLEEQGDLFQVE